MLFPWLREMKVRHVQGSVILQAEFGMCVGSECQQYGSTLQTTVVPGRQIALLARCWHAAAVVRWCLLRWFGSAATRARGCQWRGVCLDTNMPPTPTNGGLLLRVSLWHGVKDDRLVMPVVCVCFGSR